MMKHARSLKPVRTLLMVACTLLTVSTSKADILQFTVNTAPLVGNANGPFSLDFQLTDGSGTLAGPNTVTLSNFVFTGGNPTGSPSLTGGATGDLSSSVVLSDSANFLNEFFQSFSPGTTKISFVANLTTNIDPGLTPDAFSMAILDNTLLNIGTNGPGDNLLLVNINKHTLTASDAQRFTSTSPAGVTVAAVPEPSSFGMVLAILVGLLGFRLYRLVKA
jgi:hypothetical protein